MRYRWTLRNEGLDPGVRGQVAQLGLPTLLADCLAVRGVVEVEYARLFLEPRLRDLTDPFDFPGMSPMVEHFEFLSTIIYRPLLERLTQDLKLDDKQKKSVDYINLLIL